MPRKYGKNLNKSVRNNNKKFETDKTDNTSLRHSNSHCGVGLQKHEIPDTTQSVLGSALTIQISDTARCLSQRSNR